MSVDSFIFAAGRFTHRRWTLFAALLLLAGCTNLSPRPRSAWRSLDSDAPLGAQEPVTAGRLPGPAVESPGRSPAKDDPSRNRDAAKGRPEVAAPIPQRVPLPVGPRFEPNESAPPDVELSVEAPTRKQVGSHALYRVTMRNVSEQPLEDLTVQCRFDEPLVFDGSDMRSVVQKFDRLLPGESKELALSLTSPATGRHCCRFSVAKGSGSQSAELANKSVCVEFVTRQLQVEMWGPTQRTEGSRAEFTFTLENHSSRTLTDVRAVLSYDKALIAREASAGKQVQPGSLTWDLGTLRPMESIQLQAEFECRSLARRACVGLEVHAAEITSEHEEACLEILPVPGTLDLCLADRDDPLEVGKKGIYEATVRNIGLQPARRIALEAVLPEQTKFVSATVHLGETQLQIKSRREENRVIFEPIDELAADARLTYRIEVEAVRAGAAEMRVRLSSALGATLVTTAEPTVVVEP